MFFDKRIFVALLVCAISACTMNASPGSANQAQPKAASCACHDCAGCEECKAGKDCSCGDKAAAAGTCDHNKCPEHSCGSKK